MSTMAEIRPSYSLQTLKTSPTVYKSLGENSSSPSKTTPGVSKASSSMTASNKHTDEEKLTSSLVKKLAALNATAKTIPSSNAVQSIIRIASTTAANSISFPVSTSVNTTNRPNHHGSGHIHEEGTGGIIFTYFLLVVLCVCAILFFAHIFLVLVRTIFLSISGVHECPDLVPLPLVAPTLWCLIPAPPLTYFLKKFQPPALIRIPSLIKIYIDIDVDIFT